MCSSDLYKNERYLYFGKISAIFDDVLNFIPARITGILMCVGALFCGLDCKQAFRIFFRDRKKHASPNAGNPEAACAGALGVELLGDAEYFGKLYRKETVGDPVREVDPEDIKKTRRLMYATSILSLAVMAALRAFAGYCWIRSVG